MPGRGDCGRDLLGGDRARRRRRALQPAKPVEGLDRRQSLVARFRHALAHRLDPPQHFDEEAGQGEVRPVGVRRRVDENDPALPAPLRGDERRPVDQPRPGLAGEVQIRLGQHLARNRHVGRDGEPRERAVRRERRELCRLLPGQRAADRAAAAMTQPHRQQMVALLGEMRPGEAQQQPAGLDPFADSRLLRRRIRSGIREHQDRELALEKIRGAAPTHFAKGTERPLEIVVFAEQRLPLAVRRRDDPDRAPAPPFVDQQHRAGGLIAFDLDPGHAVAQLAGHRQPNLGALRPRLDRCRLAREKATVFAARTHLKEARSGAGNERSATPTSCRLGRRRRRASAGHRRVRAVEIA